LIWRKWLLKKHGRHSIGVEAGPPSGVRVSSDFRVIRELAHKKSVHGRDERDGPGGGSPVLLWKGKEQESRGMQPSMIKEATGRGIAEGGAKKI